MALSTKYSKRNSTMDLYTNEQGNILTKGDVIDCKTQPSVVTEEGYIDYYSSGAMDNIFQGPDSNFMTLQEKVKSQKLERSRRFIGRMLLSPWVIINLLKTRSNTKAIKRE